jgi:hypothetical protein
MIALFTKVLLKLVDKSIIEQTYDSVLGIRALLKFEYMIALLKML